MACCQLPPRYSVGSDGSLGSEGSVEPKGTVEPKGSVGATGSVGSKGTDTSRTSGAARFGCVARGPAKCSRPDCFVQRCCPSRNTMLVLQQRTMLRARVYVKRK